MKNSERNPFVRNIFFNNSYRIQFHNTIVDLHNAVLMKLKALPPDKITFFLLKNHQNYYAPSSMYFVTYQNTPLIFILRYMTSSTLIHPVWGRYYLFDFLRHQPSQIKGIWLLFPPVALKIVAGWIFPNSPPNSVQYFATSSFCPIASQNIFIDDLLTDSHAPKFTYKTITKIQLPVYSEETNHFRGSHFVWP